MSMRSHAQEITSRIVLQTVLRFTRSAAGCQMQSPSDLGVFMLRTGKWIALILWGIPLLAASTLGQTPSPAHQRTLKMVRKPTAQPQASMPALRTGPLPQVPMDQIPSTAPQVSYQE